MVSEEYHMYQYHSMSLPKVDVLEKRLEKAGYFSIDDAQYRLLEGEKEERKTRPGKEQ